MRKGSAIILSVFFALANSCTKKTFISRQEETIGQIKKIIFQNDIQRTFAYDYPHNEYDLAEAAGGIDDIVISKDITIKSIRLENGHLLPYVYKRDINNLYRYMIVDVPVNDGMTEKALLLFFK